MSQLIRTNSSLTFWIKNISTDIKFKVLYKTYKRITSKSGLSFKEINIAIKVIDRDYTEEFKVILVNNFSKEFNIQIKDRIA